MDLSEVLRREYLRRRARNPRYSIRAFAAWLGIDHAVLLRLLRRTHRPGPRTFARIADRLGLDVETRREAVETDENERLLSAIGGPTPRCEARWLASVLSMPLDRVQVVLQRLLADRRLTMHGATDWRTGPS